MTVHNSYVNEAQSLIDNNFNLHFFDSDLLHHLMYGEKKVNYSFLSSYLDCLKKYTSDKLPHLDYSQFIESFLPLYQNCIKDLPSSYVLFALMGFQQSYCFHFHEFRKEIHYKEIVKSLLKNHNDLPFDYKVAISLYFPQYYQLNKWIKI